MDIIPHVVVIIYLGWMMDVCRLRRKRGHLHFIFFHTKPDTRNARSS